MCVNICVCVYVMCMYTRMCACEYGAGYCFQSGLWSDDIVISSENVVFYFEVSISRSWKLSCWSTMADSTTGFCNMQLEALDLKLIYCKGEGAQWFQTLDDLELVLQNRPTKLQIWTILHHLVNLLYTHPWWIIEEKYELRWVAARGWEGKWVV